MGGDVPAVAVIDRPARPVRHVDAPLAPPSSSTGLLSVVKRRYLLHLLVLPENTASNQ
jgi:ABC-2 type transport system permease protein